MALNTFWQRYVDARITRRRILRAGGGAVAAGVLLAACGGSSKPRPAAGVIQRAGQPDILNPGGPPRRGGRFSSAEAANFGTFDPHLGVALAAAYFPRLYNVLINQAATRPEFFYFDLAESLETPDEQTYIFKLRPGVRIAPNDLGVPERDLDGEDVQATFERLRSEPATNSHSFARDYVESVTVAGDTVTIRTPRPYAWFLNRVGLFVNTIAPRELLAGDTTRLGTRAAGAGPFRLMSVTEGVEARFDRNPNYYRTDPDYGNAALPYVDGIDVKVIAERSTLRTAFESGQLHSYLPESGSEARALRGNPTLLSQPFFGYISFTMNPKRGPFGDARVRRAFSRAINRKEYVERVYKGDAKPNGLVSWPLGSYALPPEDLESTYQPFDVEEARRLVEEVGGIKVKMMWPANFPIEEHELHLPIFLRQMEQAGIEIVADAQPFGQWVENFTKVNYDCSLSLNQLYETPELPLDFHTERGPLGDGSYVRGLGDAEIEAVVRRSKETLDLDRRVEAVHAAQKVIYEKDPMMLPLVCPINFLAYSSKVRNIPGGIGTSQWLLSTFWLDT